MVVVVVVFYVVVVVVVVRRSQTLPYAVLLLLCSNNINPATVIIIIIIIISSCWFRCCCCCHRLCCCGSHGLWSTSLWNSSIYIGENVLPLLYIYCIVHIQKYYSYTSVRGCSFTPKEPLLSIKTCTIELISHNLLDALGVFWTFHWTHVRQSTGVQNLKSPHSVPDST